MLGGSELAAVPLRTMSKGMCQKVAVTQALLPRPGLLVLDEAWTGLDAAARDALDAAVAERMADGGAVVFVDHDPRRLAERDAERWQVSNGNVEVTARGAGAAGAADEGSVADSSGRPIVIEVSGYPPGPPLPGRLPGVVSVSGTTGRLSIRVEPAASGAVLRALLAAGDQVQVRSVREEPEPREQASREPERRAPDGWEPGRERPESHGAEGVQ